MEAPLVSLGSWFDRRLPGRGGRPARPGGRPRLPGHAGLVLVERAPRPRGGGRGAAQRRRHPPPRLVVPGQGLARRPAVLPRAAGQPQPPGLAGVAPAETWLVGADL